MEVVYCNSNVPCGSQREWCKREGVEGGGGEGMEEGVEGAPWPPHAAPLAVVPVE